jgi:hypothetical protein
MANLERQSDRRRTAVESIPPWVPRMNEALEAVRQFASQDAVGVPLQEASPQIGELRSDPQRLAALDQ